MVNPTVYLDMDGVLADLPWCRKMYGVEHWKQLTRNDKQKI